MKREYNISSGHLREFMVFGGLWEKMRSIYAEGWWAEGYGTKVWRVGRTEGQKDEKMKGQGLIPNCGSQDRKSVV